MRWSYKWRKELKSGLYYELLGKGFVKPEDTEPDISGFSFYFDAFDELSTTRQIGMAIGPIPFTAIVEYFRIFELSDFEDFAYIIRRLDVTFLELSAAEDSAKKSKDGGKGASGNSNKKNPNQGRHKR